MLAVNVPPIQAAVVASPATTSTAGLPPSGKWIVDGEQDHCLLARSFGAADQKVVFGLQPVDSTADVIIKVKLAGPVHLKYGQRVTVTVLPSGAGQEAPISGGPPGLDVKDGLLAVTVARSLLQHPESISMIAISTGDDTLAKITPNNLSPALAALDTCENALLTDWGIDAAERAAIATPPQEKDDPGAWLGVDDYPVDAIRAGAQGKVVARFRVNTSGDPEDCQIVESSGNQSLDRATCAAIIRKAHFHPALDTSGKPVPALQIRQAVWLLP